MIDSLPCYRCSAICFIYAFSHGSGILVTSHLCFSFLPTLVMYQHRPSKGFARHHFTIPSRMPSRAVIRPPRLRCIVLISRGISRCHDTNKGSAGVFLRRAVSTISLPNSCEGGSAGGSSEELIADRLSREIDMKLDVTTNYGQENWCCLVVTGGGRLQRGEGWTLVRGNRAPSAITVTSLWILFLLCSTR